MVAPEILADILVTELAATFPRQRLLGAWLYGSRARGEARAGSDVDLADLRRAGGLLRVEATHHGRPLTPLCPEADLFATHAPSDHAAFAPRRRAATRAFEEQLRGR